MSTLFLVLFATVGVVALSFLTNIWAGFVLTKLWVWFVVPVFHLPVLTLVPAIGVCFVVGYLTHQIPTHEDNRSLSDKCSEVVLNGILHPTIALLMGWILQMFM